MGDRDQIILDGLIEASTIRLLTHEIFMHYKDENTKEDWRDQGWMNQGVFFWRKDEKFERKSLPPFFLSYDKKYFILEPMPDEYGLRRGEATPWFGMEGGGDKLSIVANEEYVTLEKLQNNNFISYVEIVTPTIENGEIFKDKENYFFVINSDIVVFKNYAFYYQAGEISISKAYSLGGLTLVKKM